MNSQNTLQDQEIDFSQISKKAGSLYNSFWNKVVRFISFIKRNIVLVSLLFVLGAVLGFFMDRANKSYNHELIVIPNFGTADYVYSKIDILEAKIKSRDTLFLLNLGIKNPSELKKIEIQPINDIYSFINSRQQNFEFVKLMSEDGDVNKIMKDPITSKNYSYHRITLTTDITVQKNTFIDPIMKYLNDSNYYSQIQKSAIESINFKIQANERTISLIDSLLYKFSSKLGSTKKNDNMIYYNENTQLNDVLKTKNDLIYEIASKKIELINSDKIVKESQLAINIKEIQPIFLKMKVILPLLFIFIFIFISSFKKVYLRKKETYFK